MKSLPESVVLLLEDQPLIAIDTEDMLSQLGYSEILHFTSIQPALDWLASAKPDLAIMEVRLQGEPCSVVAQQLNAQKVPILVYSAASRRLSPEPCWLEAEWMGKPSDIDLMRQALARLTDRQVYPAALMAGE